MGQLRNGVERWDLVAYLKNVGVAFGLEPIKSVDLVFVTVRLTVK
jgi:hypothetical protein